MKSPEANVGVTLADRHALGEGLLLASTRRRGGVSSGPFQSLNLSFHERDRIENVLENRRRVALELGLDPNRLTCARQVHENRVQVVELEHRGRGARSKADAFGSTDGLVTAHPEIPLMAFGADCPLVVVYDERTPSVGIAHSGWRSARAKIGPRLVQGLVREFGADPQTLRAWISPSIRGCCYEVGSEVVAAFEAYGVGLRRQPDSKGEFSEERGASYLDLATILRAQLRGEGIPEEHIGGSDVCTRCRSEDYFSYRHACHIHRETSSQEDSPPPATGTGATIVMIES